MESLERCVQELLARAYSYDDKPHQLFSALRQLALRFEKDPVRRDEIVRLMDYAYEHQGAAAPVKKVR